MTSLESLLRETSKKSAIRFPHRIRLVAICQCVRIRLVYSGLRIRLAVGLSVTENESGGSLENQVGI